MHSFPHYPHPQSGTFVIVNKPVLTHDYPLCPQFTLLGFTPWYYISCEFDTCVIICIYHSWIIQKSFTTLKILWAPPIHPFILWMSITDLFIVSIVLPIPECHMIGIIPVAFSDWLVSFSNMHLKFFYNFAWLDNSFLFSTE